MWLKRTAAILHRNWFCVQGWNNVGSDIKQKVQKTFDCCGFEEKPKNESILMTTSMPQDKCEVILTFCCWHHNLNFINNVTMMSTSFCSSVDLLVIFLCELLIALFVKHHFCFVEVTGQNVSILFFSVTVLFNLLYARYLYRKSQNSLKMNMRSICLEGIRVNHMWGRSIT
jgi:hypothetical protein